jgi:putative aldouronate transport system permease protein
VVTRMATRMRQTGGDRAFDLINLFVLAVLFLSVLYPFIYIVSSSFSSTNAVQAGRVFLWPVEPSLKGYAAVFANRQIWWGFYNSLYYTVVGTTVSVILTVLAAYPLSRQDMPGRQFFAFLFLFTVMFSGGLIPTYLLVRNLRILDTRWALVFPAAVSVFNVLITRTFFQNNIPPEMLEAARMDGADDFLFLLKVVIPLSGPVIAVITLFYAVGQWNAYFRALLYLNDQKLFPLQLVLRDILISNQVDPTMISNEEDLLAREGLADLLKYSLIVVATTPVLIIYPFVQKYFVRGVMIGAIKG